MRGLLYAGLAGVLVCGTAVAAPYREIAGVCSGFNKQGDAALVTLDAAGVSVRLVRVSGEPVSLSSGSVGYTGIVGYSCKVFYSADGRTLAVGITRGYPDYTLRVVVADAAAGRWVGDYAIPQDDVLAGQAALVGFLKETPTLVVLGNAAKANGVAGPEAFSTMTIDTVAKQAGAAVSHALPADAGVIGVGFGEFADAEDNRLWFASAPEACPLRSIALVGDAPKGPSVAASVSRDLCNAQLEPMFPDADTYLLALAPEADKGVVWRVDLAKNSGEKLDLPDASQSGGGEKIDGSLLSPDRAVLAVLRKPGGDAGAGSKGNREIDVVQVTPLKFVTKAMFPAYSDVKSFSVDHRDGVVTVLGFWDQKWQRRVVKLPRETGAD